MPSTVGTIMRNGKSKRVAVAVDTGRWIIEDRYGYCYQITKVNGDLQLLEIYYDDDASDWRTRETSIDIRDLLHYCNIDGLAD